MNFADAGMIQPKQTDSAAVAEVFHAISQPLTALECGLEMSLRQDQTVAQFRARVEAALDSARIMHQRLFEARTLQDAADPGDTCQPVPLERVLWQLQEDFLPVADMAEVSLELDCAPVTIRGNEARLRRGFFHLFEFLLRTAATHTTLRILARRAGPTGLEVRFGVDDSAGCEATATPHTSNATDIGLRIAQRTFEAAGGQLTITQSRAGHVSGRVCLLPSN